MTWPYGTLHDRMKKMDRGNKNMIMMNLSHEGEEASRFAGPGRRKERRMNIGSISSKNIEEGEKRKLG